MDSSEAGGGGVTSHGDESDAALSRQRSRSFAIGLALAAFVLLFYVATLVRLGSGN